MTKPPSYSYIAGTIDDVDVENRLVWVFDKTKNRIQCTMRESAAGILRIPKQGEQWTLSRQSNFSPWILEKKLDSTTEHEAVIENMTPGDLRVSGSDTSSNVYVDGQLVINGNPPASGILQHEFFTGTSFSSITLQKAPGPSPLVFLDGLLVAPPQWTVTGNILSFDPELLGENLSVYY